MQLGETCWLWIVVVTFHRNPTLPLRGHDGRPVAFKFNANGLNTEWAPGHTIFGWYVEPALRDALATLTPDRWTLMLKDQWAMFVGYSVNVRKGGRGKALLVRWVRKDQVQVLRVRLSICGSSWGRPAWQGREHAHRRHLKLHLASLANKRPL